MMETNLTFVEGWTTSTSWARAQQPGNAKNPVNDKEWIVQCDEGDRHRVTFYLTQSRPQVQCDCDGYHYLGLCAHILTIWWDWVRGRAVVTDVDSGKQLPHPPAWVEVDDEF